VLVVLYIDEGRWGKRLKKLLHLHFKRYVCVMSKCGYAYCNNEVEQIPGKRARRFCSNTCRQKHWQERQKKQNEEGSGMIVQVEDSALQKEVELLRKENAHLKEQLLEFQKKSWVKTVNEAAEAWKGVPEAKAIIPVGHETRLQDATKPSKVVKNLSGEKPVTNYTVDTRPKTLDEIKALCPESLTGLDRSKWIAQERQKYGI
jgi:hypothetical protein